MITEFKDYWDLPFSENIQHELFKRHEHHEAVKQKEGIYYSEKDVLILLQMLQNELKK